MLRARRIQVSGRVQGVGYRAYTVDAARLEGLNGWVRNLSDGRVEVHVEGDVDALARLEWRLWQGPPGARVDDVIIEDVLVEGKGDFRIRSSS